MLEEKLKMGLFVGAMFLYGCSGVETRSPMKEYTKAVVNGNRIECYETKEKNQECVYPILEVKF